MLQILNLGLPQRGPPMSVTPNDILTIIRNQTNLFSYMFPELPNTTLNTLRFNKDKIIQETKNKTDSITVELTDGYIDTESSRLDYMQKFLSGINVNDPKFEKFAAIKEILSNPDRLQQLAQILTYGYYLSKGILGQGYEQLFKNSLKSFLASLATDATEMFNVFELIKNFTEIAQISNFEILGLLPLACQTMSNIDEKMVGFIDADIIGHGVSYVIAENSGVYKTLSITNDADDLLETYTIQEIIVAIDGQQNMRLMGSFLIPDHISTMQEPKLYITWAGTYDLATLMADFEVSAGEASYRRGELQILNQIAAVLLDLSQKTSRPIKITTSGHSLGGALAQLNYNSIQRLLALKSQDKTLVKEAQKQEDIFKDEPNIKPNYCLPPDFFETLRFPENLVVKEMVLETFNATRVLPAVANNGNALCRLLVDVGICQTVYVGAIKNDSVEDTGDRYLLDDIANNGSTFSLLLVNTDAPTIANMLESAAAIKIERSLNLFINAESAMLIGGLIYFCDQLRLKVNAHIAQVFPNSTVDPDSAYVLYCNKTKSGDINPFDIFRIHRFLCYSSYIVRLGTELIAELLNSATPEDQIRDLIPSTQPDDTYLSQIINIQDKESKKTLLHIAIENYYFKLALGLMGIENIDVNLKDTNKTSPLLALMNIMNTYQYSSPPTEAYELANLILEKTKQKLLTKPNTSQSNSVESISKSWDTQWWLFKSNATSKLCTAIQDKIKSELSIPSHS